MAIMNNYTGYDDIFIGTVMKINIETRECAAYIPKLMPNLYETQLYNNEENTNTGIILPTFKNKIQNKIHKVNYIWVKAADNKEPLPAIGQKILIRFIEGNPEYPIWWKFNPFNYLEYTTPEEQHLPLFNLKLNNDNVLFLNDTQYKMNLNDMSIDYDQKNKNIDIVSNYEKNNNESMTDAIERLNTNFLELKIFISEIMQENLRNIIPANITNEFALTIVAKMNQIILNFENLVNLPIENFKSSSQEYFLSKYKLELMNNIIDKYLVYINYKGEAGNITEEMKINIEYLINTNLQNIIVLTSNDDIKLINKYNDEILDGLKTEFILTIFDKPGESSASTEYVIPLNNYLNISQPSGDGTIQFKIKDGTSTTFKASLLSPFHKSDGWYSDPELKDTALDKKITMTHDLTVYHKYKKIV